MTVQTCCNILTAISSVLASIEAVNSKGLEIQVNGPCPTMTLDNVNGCQIYLSEENQNVQIFTSKCRHVPVHTRTNLCLFCMCIRFNVEAHSLQQCHQRCSACERRQRPQGGSRSRAVRFVPLHSTPSGVELQSKHFPDTWASSRVASWLLNPSHMSAHRVNSASIQGFVGK